VESLDSGLEVLFFLPFSGNINLKLLFTGKERKKKA
jgi:hypothetical protein